MEFLILKKYLMDLYKRKDLLLYLVTSGLKAQHRNSFLGYFWWLLDPLLGVLIYYFVVAVVFHRGGEDYGLYLVIGIVVWRWVSISVGSASKSIITQAGIIKQVYLPKAIFPIGATLTQLMNFLFGLVIIALFLIYFEAAPGIQLLWLPFILIIQLLFLTAITLILAFFCAFIRDIDTLVSHLLRLWFYGSPVIWQETMIPESLRWILNVNPMAYILTGYRDILMNQANPDFAILALIGLFSVILVIIMMCFYSIHEHKIIKSL